MAKVGLIHNLKLITGILVGLMLTPWLALAGDLAFSDPERQQRPPGDAPGYPSREAQLDVLPGFVTPPPGYGQTPFYWWGGATLHKDRIAWQLDQLKAAGIWGLMVAYPHSNDHIINNTWFGDTIESDPKVFSPAWWEIFRWTAEQCRQRGMAIGMVDYTMGFPGQGYWTDTILRKHPELNGSNLKGDTRTIAGGKELRFDIPGELLNATAWRLNGGAPDRATTVDLRPFASGGTLHWTAPADGPWQAAIVWNQRLKPSLDPISPELGRLMIKEYYQPFEDHLPGMMGRGMNIFDHDEEGLFWIKGPLWSVRFAGEFKRRKGYELLPELPALFTDFGPRTPKIRLDYWDVLVSLTEEGYFKPIFEWINQRGMLHPIDNAGRGRIPTEFGDYFRCVRWMTAPGGDQPRLLFDLIKDKVGSSMAHLYQRPRAWVEGNYGSGWGVTPGDLLRILNQHYAVGMNMFSLHGLYYDTHGGWWEWAPPCFHFRMPYWRHAATWMRYIERLSYLMSQGVHRCDVALLYPVEPGQAGMEKNEAAEPAFALAKTMAGQGLDFDFIDFESVDRAKLSERQMQVSGEAYRVLILPLMRTLHISTLRQALAFYRAGGVVVALGALPEASDRIGRNDPELDRMVQELFGLTAAQAASAKTPHIQRNAAGGLALCAQTNAQVIEAIGQAITRDFVSLAPRKRPDENTYVSHRRIGMREVYLVNGVDKGEECFFRAKGRVELWDAWSGKTRPLFAIKTEAGGTRIRMPLEAHEAQLIVFSPGEPVAAVEATSLDEVTAVRLEDGKVSVLGYADQAGRKMATVRAGGRVARVAGETSAATSVTLQGEWEFELTPTMDNHWGDFRLPASPELIGAEARQFRYAAEEAPHPGWENPVLDDSHWSKQTASFGPRFWKLGPLPERADAGALESRLAKLTRIDPQTPVEFKGRQYFWQPYEFSWRWGLEGHPGNQGYHGLKARLTDDFISLGLLKNNVHDFDKHFPESGGTRYYLWSSVFTTKALEARLRLGGQAPAGIWLNGAAQLAGAKTTALSAGSNPLLLRYDAIGRAHVVFEDPDTARDWPQPCPLAMTWFDKPGVLPFDPTPWVAQPAGWYRFTAPPALQSMRIVARGAVRAWVGGKPLPVKTERRLGNGTTIYTATVENPATGCVAVALRIEPERGGYGGAALPEPIALCCGRGRFALGDWSRVDGLLCYSGAAWYRKEVMLSPEQTRGQVLLNLGAVAATAEVRINGQAAGARVAPPWFWDISSMVRPGVNRIEVLVCNTLANHYVTIPTQYRGSTLSGLLGPVTLTTRPAALLRE